MHKLLPYTVAMLSAGLPNAAPADAAPIFVVDSQNTTDSIVGSDAFWAMTHNNTLSIGSGGNTLSIGTSGIVVLLCWTELEPTGPGLSYSNGTLGASNTSLQWLVSNLKSAPTGTLAANNQGVVIGIKGGACAPSWLGDSSIESAPVPIPKFEILPWAVQLGEQSAGCTLTPLPASWDATYESEYLSVVGSLVSILSTITMPESGSHLIDHVVAIADGSMIQTGTDEMGVHGDGCTSTSSTAAGTLFQTRYQVAQTWASLPPPDNYTPAKAQAAYRNVFDGLLNIVAGLPHNRFGAQIGVTQNLDGSDGHDWPGIDANGIPLPPQDSPVAAVPMYAPILGQAGTDALACFANHGTLSNGVVLSNCETATQLGSVTAASEAVFGWPGLYNDSTSNPNSSYSGTATQGVVLIVNSGALNGTGVKWQTNADSNTAAIDQPYFSDFGASGLSTLTTLRATSCEGREAASGTPPLCGTWSEFGTIQLLAAESSSGTISGATTLHVSGGPGINPPSPYSSGSPTLLLKWIEVQPIDGLPVIDSSNGNTLGPLYGCFDDGTGFPYGPIGPEC